MEHAGAIAVGQLLVATNPGRGGFFDRTVILLISHNDSGTIGLCLNLLSDDEASSDCAADAFRLCTRPNRSSS